MLSMRIFTRVTSSQLPSSCQFHKLSPLFCSKREDPPEDNGEEKPQPKKNLEAIKKLNLLLKSMTEEKYEAPSSGIGSQLARPPVKPKKEYVKNAESLTTAAKEVAEVLGGDTKQTESELLNKLLSPSQITNKDEKEESKPPVILRDLISSMKIDRSKRPDVLSETGRAKQVRRILEGRETSTAREHDLLVGDDMKDQHRPKMYVSKVDLFGGEPLGIFTVPELGTHAIDGDKEQLSTWNRLEARELRLAVTHPPANIFEEMIQWTEQGKLWHFPINNEQGQDEESKVYFTEHVFLEHLLDPWCPKKGPVRHFMELVCVGLSKNPYITVQMKMEHIHWFRDYFQQKKQVLEETGALPHIKDSGFLG
ncbi:small ribosomal subunit protein mS31 isoform X2 [Periplaneta americana]|uniref:small ribosomal subunit protein mS31 isoform X2 n=1 Tax=Periplaneta americana TaxID=6978 RepID=UPI0037E8553A